MTQVTSKEIELLGDSKYRSYMSSVDKALKSFETTSEWADLISALTRLNKVFVSHSKYTIIPKRVTIGKRLAQCLHPALPTGVHLKVIETYDTIFKLIGSEGLARELFVYSSGLFPLLSYAGSSVRPTLLKLYEEHYLSLGPEVRPALPGLVPALLPGLEEGASELHARTTRILERLASSVGQDLFYTTLWQTVSGSPGVRQQALAFVLEHWDKEKPIEEQRHILGTDLDLMVSGMSGALGDSSALVQRSALDLLLKTCPLGQPCLARADLVTLVAAALGTLTRRDMSLNRRLYSWLLGSDTSNTQQLATSSDGKDNSKQDSDTFFQQCSRGLILSGIRRLFGLGRSSCGDVLGDCEKQGVEAKLRPLKVLIGVLDKPEIGPEIMEGVMLELLQYLRDECDGPPPSSRASSELLKTANLLFGSFESGYLWSVMGRVFSEATTHQGSLPTSLEDICGLLQFLLKVITMESFPEIQTQHLPNLLLLVLRVTAGKVGSLPPDHLAGAVAVCSAILTHVLPVAAAGDGTDYESSDSALSPVASPTSPLSRPEFSRSSRSVSRERERRSLIPDCLMACQDLLSALIHERLLRVTDRGSLVERFGLPSKESSHDTRPLVLNPPEVSCESREGAEELEELFASVCPLLFALACFPTHTAGSRGHSLDRSPAHATPVWLQRLMLCCVTDNFSLATTATTLLLDLVSLSLSLRQQSRGRDGEGGTQPEMGVVAVVMAPPLIPRDVTFIRHDTTFLESVCMRLWHHLSPDEPLHHAVSANLLCHAHQLAACPLGVQPALATAMARQGEETEGLRRFVTLWHLSRGASGVHHAPGSRKRGFEKLELLLLGRLVEGSEPERALAREWLRHALQRGDLARVLEAPLLLLLTPDTARVSIQHVSFQRGEDLESSRSRRSSVLSEGATSEPYVYAISSEGGHVMYHVSRDGPTIAKSQAHREKNFAMTSGDGSETNVISGGPEQPPEMELEPESVRLRVNPFLSPWGSPLGSEASLDLWGVAEDRHPTAFRVVVVVEGGEGGIEHETRKIKSCLHVTRKINYPLHEARHGLSTKHGK